VKGESHTRTPNGGGTGATGGSEGTAFTGSSSASFALIAGLLTTVGLVSLYIARRRAARLES
jgi:LPXTG-motif cell wall-anchored protein